MGWIVVLVLLDGLAGAHQGHLVAAVDDLVELINVLGFKVVVVDSERLSKQGLDVHGSLD